jgi:YD repeat-containing protein
VTSETCKLITRCKLIIVDYSPRGVLIDEGFEDREHWIQDSNGQVAAINTQEFDYDSLNRIQRVKEGTSWQQEYVYDRYGNRTIHQTNTWGPTSGPLIPKPNFEVQTSTNRLYGPGDLALSDDAQRLMRYDEAGNLKKDAYAGAGDREYDAENRMTKAWGNGQWQYYTYNADGQRVRRKVDGVETWQVYGVEGELL